MNNIYSIINNELDSFNEALKRSLSSSVNDYNIVLDYILTIKGKQLRPIIGILLAKLLGNFNDNQCKLLQAVELIHNATLFHDDIIDEADFRRNMPALHKKFSSKIAILSGDYFLSSALKIIFDINNFELNSLLTSYMKLICEGEIEQNLTLYKLPSLDNYLNKTKKKTALLFEFTTLGISILSDNNNYNNESKNLGFNFGMFFQINDDFKNFQESDNKPVLNDLKSGIITAPIIFLAEEFQNIQQLINNNQYDEILSLLKRSNAKMKTNELMQTYLNNCIDILNLFPYNQYHHLLLDFLNNFKISI